MKLTLDRLDLRKEYKDISCSKTKFGHFSDKAQVAIRTVGRAVFYEYDRSSYNAIYPPKVEKALCFLSRI